MKRLCILSLLIALPACSGDDTTPGGGDDGSADSMTGDTGTGEETSTMDATSADSTAPDTGADAGPGEPDATSDVGTVEDAEPGHPDATPDSGPIHDAGTDADAEVTACIGAWLVPPDVSATAIALPADAGTRVLLHAGATGTQNYKCSMAAVDAGYTWNLVTPDATLVDCHGTTIAHHFASEAGAGSPEWQLEDGTYVVAQKAGAYTPDAGSIPWLLLRIVTKADGGVLGPAEYIQRLDTDEGNAPSATCDDAGALVNVPYSADYYFFGH